MTRSQGISHGGERLFWREDLGPYILPEVSPQTGMPAGPSGMFLDAYWMAP